MAGISGVELCEDGGGDPLEHLLGEDTEQLPPNVKGLEHSAVLIVTLCNEVLLKLGQELEVQQIVGGQGFLSYDGFHGLHILTDGVTRVQLVGNVRVVLTGHALSDG